MQIDVEECFQKYSPMVYRRCLQLLNVEALASDATQDVFVQLISNQERIENRAMISLLYRIATNVSLNIIRDRKTYDKRMEEFQSDYLLNKIAFNDQIEGSAIAENMLYRLFRRCPPSSKTIAVLYYYDGMTLEEVAEAMDMSVSGIRKRLRFLRGKLEELEGAIE